MNKVIFVIGILAIIEGIAMNVRPDLYRKVIGLFNKGKIFYLAAILKIVFGVILLMSVTSCKKQMQLVILILGACAVIGGTAMFFISGSKLKSFFAWFSSRGNWFYRALGLLAIALGCLFIYSA